MNIYGHIALLYNLTFTKPIKTTIQSTSLPPNQPIKTNQPPQTLPVPSKNQPIKIQQKEKTSTYISAYQKTPNENKPCQVKRSQRLNSTLSPCFLTYVIF